MRGKKFLDAYLVKPPAGAGGREESGKGGAAATDPQQLLNASIFGFGFLGPTGAPGAAPGRGHADKTAPLGAVGAAVGAGAAAASKSGKRFGDVLMVQDSTYLLLVQRTMRGGWIPEAR